MEQNALALLNFLQRNGACTSAQIQSALQTSQPTVSRLLASVSDQVLTLGQARARRYALAQAIGHAAAQQPIWHLDAQGQPQRIGILSFLAHNQIHIAAEGVNLLFTPSPQEELPWFLATLRAQGFLGRLNAAHLAMLGVPSNIERWDTATILLAALHTRDAPGSLLLGDMAQSSPLPTLPEDDGGATLDALSADVASTLPAGSSAGGEQPKFLATTHTGASVLVKFSPPRGTPYGERWSDLLHAEALSSTVLQRHGQAAAPNTTVSTATRTYLLSPRFDRIAATRGRIHTVALGAVHAPFVHGPYVRWAATCEALAQQGRLSSQDAQTAAFYLQFGRLIGNTDMHSGNASLHVVGSSLADMLKGQFSLAPSYDMLPMRWKPNPLVDLPDYAPFTPDTTLTPAAVRLAAVDYWESLSQLPAVSPALRTVAALMSSSLL